MKRHFLFAALLTCFCVFTTLGQTAEELGLVLRSKQSCSMVDNSLSCQTLPLEFQNKGSSPVIIINPALTYGSGLKEVIYYFANYNRETGKWVISGQGKVPVKPLRNIETLESMSRIFDGDRPPENFTVTLQPGETFTFRDSVNADLPTQLVPERKYTTIDPKTGESVERTERAWRRGPNCFRLVYEFSFLPFVSDPDFLEHLNMKWKRYGRMPVEEGVYTVTSASFSCTLP